jgi:hypothetical protein
MKHLCTRSLFAGLLLAATLCHAEVYRWVDEQGQTHFADQPRHSQPHEIAVRPSPSTAADPGQRMDRTRRLLNAFQIERQQQREEKAKRQEQMDKRRRSCLQARDALRRYSESGNIYRLDESGNRVYLSESERASAIRKHRQAVADWCD